MDRQEPARLGRPRRAPGQQSTKSRIFDAAVELFARHGYDGASVRDIAGAVGLTEGAVYKHYTGKEAILEEILDYFTTQVYQDLPPPTESPQQGVSVFRAMLAGLPRFIAANPTMMRIGRIIMIEAYHNARIQDYLREQFGERSAKLTESLLAKERDEGRLRPLDTRALAGLFNAFRFGWVYWTFLLDTPEPFDLASAEEELLGMIGLLEELTKPGA